MDQARCNVSGWPLFALLDKAGEIVGIENCGGEQPGTTREHPAPNGDYHLPLHGNQPKFDLTLEILEAPRFEVLHDRVVRSFVVRPKLASEILDEIGFFFAAMNRRHEAQA